MPILGMKGPRQREQRVEVGDGRLKSQVVHRVPCSRPGDATGSARSGYSLCRRLRIRSKRTASTFSTVGWQSGWSNGASSLR